MHFGKSDGCHRPSGHFYHILGGNSPKNEEDFQTKYWVPMLRNNQPNPEASLLLLGGVSMNRKAYGRKVPKLDYEQVKFNWEE